VLLSYFRSSIAGDKKLVGSASKPASDEGVGLNLVRACSEAVWTAVAKTLAESENGLAEVFAQELNPAPKFKRLTESQKFLLPILLGGKLAGSQVKFSRFYLIVDPIAAQPDTVITALKTFYTALRKSISATKGGEAAFKIDGEGPCFNACSSINESFKQIEDAIAQAVS